MTENDFKKLVVSITVGAVLLLVILLSVMVYQLVSIGKLKSEEAELKAKIQEYQVMIDDTEDTIEARSMRWWIERRAREIGYVYEGDVPLE